MTQNRKKQIKTEAQKRLNQWLKHSTFNKMTVQGSYIRFNMALGLNGYPFVKEKWMGKDEFNSFINDREFDSIEYDEIVNDLFYLAQSGQTNPVTRGSTALVYKQETLEEVPTKLESVLAKISHQNGLGLSQWYEVVYYDGKWRSYSGSTTFKDGEIVVEWKYCKELF